MKWGWLFVAGGAGVVLRYLLADWIQARVADPFPWGTFVVNVTGCFAIGLIATSLEERSMLSPELRLTLLVGLLGGFTTFSAFGLETWKLLEGGDWTRALANALGSVALGLFAVVVGVRVARWLA